MPNRELLQAHRFMAWAGLAKLKPLRSTHIYKADYDSTFSCKPTIGLRL